jgi:hypothetical protein
VDLDHRRDFGREIPTYAESVSANDLNQGEVYFSVQYADEGLLLPIMETLVFTGREKGEDGSVIYCFQDLTSHQQGIKRGSQEAERALFYFQHANQLRHIFEYDCALDELIRCSLRRQKEAGLNSS